MLRITIDLIPHGDKSRTQTISEIEITNDGTGSAEYGNYGATINLGSSLTAITHVSGFPRKLGVLQLLRLILNQANERDMLDTLQRARDVREEVGHAG